MRRMNRARSSRSSVEARGRLVEQQQLRLDREGPGEADQLLHPERQARDGRVAMSPELDEIEDLLDHAAMLDLLVANATAEDRLADEVRAETSVPADQQVLDDRQVREQLAVLEGARDPEPRDVVRFDADDIVPLKTDAPRGRTVEAADAVEHARLARTVRPDQREELATLHEQRNVVEDDEAAEAERDVLDRQLSHTTAGCAGTASLAGSCAARPPTARGRTRECPGGPRAAPRRRPARRARSP